MSKFKSGDVVVRTKDVDSFFNKGTPTQVSEVCDDVYLLFDETGYTTWDADNFEFYVEPENKVPDNMEVVGYQVKFVDIWTSVSAQLYADAISLGYDTRLMYAFKQD